MPNKKFAVIGGTTYDTRLGCHLLKELGVDAIRKSLKENAIEQNNLQLHQNVEDYIINEIENLKHQHLITHVVIYCVSISGLINHTKIENLTGVILITAYTSISNRLEKMSKIGVIAANDLSADNFEKHILKFNENCIVLKKTEINIVNDIEHNINPDKIIKKHEIDRFIDNLVKNKVKNLVLGCTHFSYLLDELYQFDKIKILDVKSFIINELRSTHLRYD